MSSGLSVKQYCQQYHIPESTMYKKKKELQMTHDTRLFLPVQVPPDILLHVVINDIPMQLPKQVFMEMMKELV